MKARPRPLALLGRLALAGAGLLGAAPWALAGSASVASDGAPEVVPPTGFGGYSWAYGPVSEVGAQWRVPTISSRSPLGHASTWVGAQNSAGGYPFIQLGTTEDTAGGPGQYHVFWSDSTVGFRPQFLGTVAAGDVVRATMDRQGDRWSLSVDDRTSGRAMRADIAFGGGAPFTQAEWLQEDPTAANEVASDLPYPTMSNEHFADLSLNDQTPELSSSNAQTLMAANGAILMPSAERGDSFTLAPPGGVRRQILTDARPLYFALNSYNYEVQSWPKLSQSARLYNVHALASQFATFNKELSSQSWPAGYRRALAATCSANTKVIVDLVAWQWAGLGSGTEQFIRVEKALEVAANAPIANGLGLPAT